MWQPVSKLDYVVLNPEAHAIVVTCLMTVKERDVAVRWATKGVALVGDSGRFVRDVVRDVLANPQIRAVVFDGPVCGREAYDKFWAGPNDPAWRIDAEHLNLVRQFVDLFDDDCGWRAPPQPFWPARVLYLEELELP